MLFYVMSGNLYADGGRGWVPSKQQAWCFLNDLESAKHHADTFRDPQAQLELRTDHAFRETPGHKDARVVGYCEEE